MSNVTTVKNIAYLFVAQGSNYVVPLLIFPYLVQSLGVDGFGKYSYVIASISLFRLVVSYGFDLTGVRDIASCENNFLKINKIVSEIYAAKLILLSGCAAVFFLGAVILVPKQEYYLYFAAFLIVFADYIFPSWILQGIGEIKLLTACRIFYKVVGAVLILVFVRSVDDIFLAIFIDSAMYVVVSIFSAVYIKNKYNIKYISPAACDVMEKMKTSRDVFLSSVVVYFYSTINIILIGWMASSREVGVYVAAEKIYMALRGIYNPIVQGVYPVLSRLYGSDRNKYKKIAKTTIVGMIIILLVSACVVFWFRNWVVNFVVNSSDDDIVQVLSVFLIGLVFAVGGVYSSMLVIKNMGKKLLYINSISMIVNILFIYPAYRFFGVLGVAALFVFVQIMQFFMQSYYNRELYK